MLTIVILRKYLSKEETSRMAFDHIEFDKILEMKN